MLYFYTQEGQSVSQSVSQAMWPPACRTDSLAWPGVGKTSVVTTAIMALLPSGLSWKSLDHDDDSDWRLT